MTRLIPTPIVDVNGRLTTVHKRAEEASKANSALSGIRPSLGTPSKTADKVNVVKPKKLPQLSDAVRLGKLLGALTTEDEIESFTLSSSRSPVQMTDSEVFYALRKGITMQDAAALKTLGITTDDVIEKTKEHFTVGGSLSKVKGRGHTSYTTKLDGAVDRLEAAGVSAIEADKLISNGLQEGHFNRALDEAKVLEVFSKWRYRSEADSYEHGHVEQDDVIEGFLSGRLPFDLIGYKAKELKNSEIELFDLYERKFEYDGRTPWKNPDPELAERLKDMDYRSKLVGKVAEFAPDLYKPLGDLDKIVQRHGEKALELKDPRKATMGVFVSAGVSRECGVEAAHYVEKVHELAKDQIKRDIWGTGSDIWTSRGTIEANGHYVRNWDLIDLYEQGVPVEQAYDMLVNVGMSKDQILVARDTGVGTNLASGVL